MISNEFWKEKKLSEMTLQEWESLCDGCARCCVYKLEDIDTREFYYTNVACRLLDIFSCKCRDYPNRNTLEPGCVILTPQNVYEIKWLPQTCAYRLIAEGKPLPKWHPLVSGSKLSVHRAGISIRNKVLLEKDIDMKKLDEYVVDWLK